MVRWTEQDVAALQARRGESGALGVVMCGPCSRGEHRKCLRREAPPKPCDCTRHRSKYKNETAYVGDERFDSKREAARYRELLLEQRAGKITKLRRQVRFALVVNRMLICEYVADMVYERDDGVEIVEDAKGCRTEVYRLKRRLMLAIHGIEIREV